MVVNEQQSDDPYDGIRGLYDDYWGEGDMNDEDRVLHINPGRIGNSWISLPFTVGETTLVGLLDTGATVNLMPTLYAEELQLDPYESLKNLTVPGGRLITSQAVKLDITIGKLTREVEFQLYSSSNKLIILGMGVFVNFQLTTNYLKKVFQSTKPQHYTPL